MATLEQGLLLCRWHHLHAPGDGRCEKVVGHDGDHCRAFPDDGGRFHWSSDAPEAFESHTRPAESRQVGGNHYSKFKIQPWAIIDEYGLSFYTGNVLKYLLRAGHKGVALEDLKKARHYLDRVIEIEEGK